MTERKVLLNICNVLKWKFTLYLFIVVLGRDPQVMTNSIKRFFSKVMSNLHPKLEFEAFLRTKGTVEASCTKQP